MRLLALLLGVLGLFCPAQAQQCELTDGIMTHLLRVLQAQASVQGNIMYKIGQLNAVYGGGVVPNSMAMEVDASYAEVLGDTGNAWADGSLSPDEIAADAEAAALAQAFREQMAAELGVDVDQIQINAINSPGVGAGRRLLEGENVGLSIAYTAPRTGKYL